MGYDVLCFIFLVCWCWILKRDLMLDRITYVTRAVVDSVVAFLVCSPLHESDVWGTEGFNKFY